MTTITMDRAMLEQIKNLLPRLEPTNFKDQDEQLSVFEKLNAALAATPSGPDHDMAAIKLAMEAAWQNGFDAAMQSGPAWHDAPTEPGIWLCDEGDICYEWTAHSIEILDQFEPGEGFRWFGPIPPDGDTK